MSKKSNSPISSKNGNLAVFMPDDLFFDGCLDDVKEALGNMGLSAF